MASQAENTVQPNDPAQTRVDPSRRRALQVAGTGITACAVLGVCGMLRFFLPQGASPPPIRAGLLGEFPPRSLRLLANAPIYIIHEDEGFAALSARCPHLGCLVQRRGDGFVCPCHGSEFDGRGGYVRGAARRGLVWLRVRIVEGTLFVEPSLEVPSGTFVYG